MLKTDFKITIKGILQKVSDNGEIEISDKDGVETYNVLDYISKNFINQNIVMVFSKYEKSDDSNG